MDKARDDHEVRPNRSQAVHARRFGRDAPRHPARIMLKSFIFQRLVMKTVDSFHRERDPRIG
jgi:hypothetical protein